MMCSQKFHDFPAASQLDLAPLCVSVSLSSIVCFPPLSRPEHYLMTNVAFREGKEREKCN